MELIPVKLLLMPVSKACMNSSCIASYDNNLRNRKLFKPIVSILLCSCTLLIVNLTLVSKSHPAMRQLPPSIDGTVGVW